MGFEGKNLRIVGTAAFKLPDGEGEAPPAPVAKVNEDGEPDENAEEDEDDWNTKKITYTAPVKMFRLTGEFA